jgi:hypothetical protein
MVNVHSKTILFAGTVKVLETVNSKIAAAKTVSKRLSKTGSLTQINGRCVGAGANHILSDVSGCPYNAKQTQNPIIADRIRAQTKIGMK